MIKFSKKERYIILIMALFLGCFCFFGKADAATYETSGTLVSKNLLDAQYVNSIDGFGYNATIPANTSIKVQFSQNKTNWYDSSGAEDAWDTLSDGDYTSSEDAIDLSGLGWTKPYFFYKISFTTLDSSTTGVLSEVRVYFDEGEEPATTYETSGTLISKNLLEGEVLENIIGDFSYNASSIPSGTSLRVQFSQDKVDWYNSSGESDGWDNCSEGEYSINLSGLNWSDPDFYYKMEFSSDGDGTPILGEVSVSSLSLPSPASINIKGGIMIEGGMILK